MDIFHKTEVQTVILRCLTGLKLNWFNSYGLKCSLKPNIKIYLMRAGSNIFLSLLKVGPLAAQTQAFFDKLQI